MPFLGACSTLLRFAMNKQSTWFLKLPDLCYEMALLDAITRRRSRNKYRPPQQALLRTSAGPRPPITKTPLFPAKTAPLPQ